MKVKKPPEGGKVLKTKELGPERHLMIREMRASLKMGVQLGKLIQVVMVILMGMGGQIKAGNHPERGKNHQMGLGEMGVEEDQILVMMMEMEVDLLLCCSNVV